MMHGDGLTATNEPVMNAFFANFLTVNRLITSVEKVLEEAGSSGGFIGRLWGVL